MGTEMGIGNAAGKGAKTIAMMNRKKPTTKKNATNPTYLAHFSASESDSYSHLLSRSIL
jgi:hypothetical protein